MQRPPIPGAGPLQPNGSDPRSLGQRPVGPAWGPGAQGPRPYGPGPGGVPPMQMPYGPGTFAQPSRGGFAGWGGGPMMAPGWGVRGNAAGGLAGWGGGPAFAPAQWQMQWQGRPGAAGPMQTGGQAMAATLSRTEVDNSRLGRFLRYFEPKPQAVGAEEKPLPGDSDYRHIAICKSFAEQLMNDVTMFYTHWKRACDHFSLVTQMASPAEREFLKAHEPDAAEVPVLVNMLVWRRSILKVVVVLMGFFIIVNAGVMIGQLERADYLQNDVSNQITIHTFRSAEPDYHHLGDNDKPPDAADDHTEFDFSSFGPTSGGITFGQYTKAVLKEVVRPIKMQTNVAAAVGTGIVTLVYIVAFMLICFALTKWSNALISRRLALLAWLLSSGAPFIAALIPTGFFISMEQSPDILIDFIDDVGEHFQVQRHIESMYDRCQQLKVTDYTNNVNRIKSDIRTACHIVNFFPRGKWSFPPGGKFWKPWKTIDTGKQHKSCEKALKSMKEGKIEEALYKVRDGCAKLDDMALEYAERPGLVDYVVYRATDLSNILISLGLAFQDLAMMLPAAISIPPGFIIGAKLLKLVVPQSTMPGILIMMFPCTFAPIVWTLCSVISQVAGDFFMGVGLMFLSFWPAIYVVLGKYYHIDDPLTDKQVVRAMTAMSKVLNFVLVSGIVCIVICILRVFWRIYQTHQSFVLEKDQAADWWLNKEKELLMSIWEVDNLWALVSSRGTQFMATCFLVQARIYLSSVAAFDLMVATSVQQYAEQQAMYEALKVRQEAEREFKEKKAKGEVDKDEEFEDDDDMDDKCEEFQERMGGFAKNMQKSKQVMESKRAIKAAIKDGKAPPPAQPKGGGKGQNMRPPGPQGRGAGPLQPPGYAAPGYAAPPLYSSNSTLSHGSRPPLGTNSFNAPGPTSFR